MRLFGKMITGSWLFIVCFIFFSPVSAGAVDYSFTVEVVDPIQVVSLEDFTILKSVITNTGDQPDTLDVFMEVDLPDSSWMVLLCVGPICFPPGVSQAPLPLGSQETDSATVDITAFNVHGGATASLTFQSRGNPSLVETVYFGLITDGTEVLVVDGDGGSDYETFYKEAVPASFSSGIWDLSLEPVTSPDLGIFDFCLWLTGERVPALTTEEMGTLSTFLDSGGKLFISGQDIGRDIGETAFYSDYLHATFLSDSTGILSLDGIDGDPISDGLSFDISGGDGANNQVRPSEIAPTGSGAYASFYYGSTQRVAAVSSMEPLLGDTVNSRQVAYFAFGFEGISSQSDRNTVMQRVLDWLSGLTVGIGRDRGESASGPDLPQALVLRQNYPNPFNPSTTIEFELRETSRVHLSIYDMRGRLVRTLIDESLPTGHHSVVWDGRSDKGVRMGSGNYLYRLRSNGNVMTRRMIVVK